MGTGAISPLVWGVLAVSGFVGLALGLGLWRVSRMPRKQKKLMLKRHLRHAWRWMEEAGLVEKNPALIRDYHRFYPELAVLERHFEVIQKECLELMAVSDKIPHIRESAGRYTTGGIHEAEWKTFKRPFASVTSDS